jgi:hypothetical protein
MTEMREKIARALARRVGTEDSWQCWTNEADAVLALIEPVMEENERLREALTPSADTKAAYIGEFKMPVVRVDECGDEYTEQITVSWDVTKEIMAAIKARAALSPSEKQDG